MSHRSRISVAGVSVSSALALVALSAPVFAQQAKPPAADCMKTETQAECHTRLKCKPDEELEDCKKRLRAAQQKDGKTGEGDDADRDGDDREGGDRDRDRDRGDRDRDRDRDRDDPDRKRDRDRDDPDRKRDRRDRDRDRDDDDAKDRDKRNEGGVDKLGPGRGDDDDDDDDDGGGGDGGDSGGGRGRGGVLRRGTRPGFFSGGVGPSWGFCYRDNCGPGDVDYAAFYGTLDFGWHFSGTFKGPAIGANIHAGYGGLGPFDHGRFGAGVKFWWDIPMASDLGIYFTPFVQAGWSSFIYESRPICDSRFFHCNDDWEHFFNVQGGAMFRFILGNRGLLYFQPITFDNVINGDGYGLLYHFEIGGGVIFGG